MTLQNALSAELLKIKRSPILWVTFGAFALGPVMGGLSLFLLGSSNEVHSSSMLGEKAKLMAFTADWNSHFTILSQVVGVGGIIVFGFVVSWLFGREYSDRTAKDLLALPTSRSRILNAKFLVYILWCLGLVVSNFLLGMLIGTLLQLEGFTFTTLLVNLKMYLYTSVMVIALGFPLAFFALWGKGYLAPIGFVVLTLVISQIVAAVGFGHYFPWSVPGLFSGISVELKSTIDFWSFFILAAVSLGGYFFTHIWWNKADQQ